MYIPNVEEHMQWYDTGEIQTDKANREGETEEQSKSAASSVGQVYNSLHLKGDCIA